jgi:hypothetical protein
VHAHGDTCTHTHTHTHTQTHTGTHVRGHIHTRMCTGTRACSGTYTHPHTGRDRHTHTHTHTHTISLSFSLSVSFSLSLSLSLSLSHTQAHIQTHGHTRTRAMHADYMGVLFNTSMHTHAHAHAHTTLPPETEGKSGHTVANQPLRTLKTIGFLRQVLPCPGSSVYCSSTVAPAFDYSAPMILFIIVIIVTMLLEDVYEARALEAHAGMKSRSAYKAFCST